MSRLPDRHWLLRQDRLEKITDLDDRLGRVTRKITPHRVGDLSFGAYFRRFPADVPREDWLLARSFVEGFEAAPLDQISARSLAGENMDEQHQYKLRGGYDQIVTALVEACPPRRVRLHRGAVVQAVQWRRGRVSVTARHAEAPAGRIHTARAVVVALPLGVLQRRTGLGAVQFVPPLRQRQAWIDRMRMGQVVRMAVRFEPRAWRRLLARVAPTVPRGGIGFVHSLVKGVPVWWSLSDQPVMIGWAGGPAARALLKFPEAVRRERALRSLAGILHVAPSQLRRAVWDWQGWDWSHDPFSCGAYSFTAAGADEGAKRLRQPIQGTLFFAGEATADGAEVGTVHGALSSGIRAAKEVLQTLGRSRRGK